MKRSGIMNQLRRIEDNDWFGGVCAGFAYWLGWPTWLIRLAWGIAILVYGIGLVPYLFFWLFMPKWDKTPADYHEICD